MFNFALIDEMKASKGSPDEDNVHIRKAHNMLDKALLQLDYSEVRDERAGVVGNL